MPVDRPAIIPTAISELKPGHFWAIPLRENSDKFACGIVMQLEGVGTPRRQPFLGALLDWVGDRPPTVDQIEKIDTVLIHAITNVGAITASQGRILGVRDLAKHPLELPETISHRAGGQVWIVKGHTRIRKATEAERSSLQTISTAGKYAFRAVAEDKFLRSGSHCGT